MSPQAIARLGGFSVISVLKKSERFGVQLPRAVAIVMRGHPHVRQFIFCAPPVSRSSYRSTNHEPRGRMSATELGRRTRFVAASIGSRRDPSEDGAAELLNDFLASCNEL